MHTIKLLLTYYLNISVQAANLSDCRIEPKKIDSVARIESNRNFCPNWNALVGSITNDADYLTRPGSCRKAADKSRPTLLPFSWPQYQQSL